MGSEGERGGGGTGAYIEAISMYVMREREGWTKGETGTGEDEHREKATQNGNRGKAEKEQRRERKKET